MIDKTHKEYFTYISKYLGAALIAGSVVHVGTLNNGFTRYLALGLVGLFLMILGNVYESKQKAEKVNLNYLLLITGLSLGTGFLSGGLQHYVDNPSYAGMLLGIGFFFAYITYFTKEHLSLKIKNIIVVAIFSILVILLSIHVMDTFIRGEDHHKESVFGEHEH